MRGLLAWFVLCLLLSEALEFAIEKKRKKKKSKKETASKGVSFLRKFNDIPMLPKIKEEGQEEIIARVGIGAYNPCKITKICQNGGTCFMRNITKTYACSCADGYYGRYCEYFADKKNCRNHKCQNNAECYSTENAREIILPARQVIDDKELHNKYAKEDPLIESVKYECWCRPGFSGSLCEYSEEQRQCEQDTCLHGGIGKLVNNSGNIECHCMCLEYYEGERCELVLPCKDYRCYNGGTCHNVKDGTEGNYQRYKAKCECPPRALFGTAARFTGDQCDEITVFDETRSLDECFPCAVDMNAIKYKERCIDALTQPFLAKRLQKIIETAKKSVDVSSFDTYCLNGGICDVEGVLDNATSYVVPVCRCMGANEGELCEIAVISPCDKPDLDKRKGDKKCGDHGVCIAKSQTDFICDCNPGWAGERCDIEEPCHSNKCSEGSLCVAVPTEQRETYSLGYTCLCDVDQDAEFEEGSDVVQCRQASFVSCKNHSCANGGQCYPCDEHDEKNLRLCSEEEKTRGYRCLCPGGLLPPFCKHAATACTGNKCRNDTSECKVDPKNAFGYICKCKPGYHGEYCEFALSPCTVQGLHSCVMGTCVQNDKYARGFECECIEGYVGIDCNIPIEYDPFGYIDQNYVWTYPLIVSIIFSPIAVVLTIINENRAQRVYSLRLAEKRKIEALNKQESASERVVKEAVRTPLSRDPAPNSNIPFSSPLRLNRPKRFSP